MTQTPSLHWYLPASSFYSCHIVLKGPEYLDFNSGSPFHPNLSNIRSGGVCVQSKSVSQHSHLLHTMTDQLCGRRFFLFFAPLFLSLFMRPSEGNAISDCMVLHLILKCASHHVIWTTCSPVKPWTSFQHARRQVSHFSLLPKPPVKPGSGRRNSKIFTDFQFASDMTWNFRDNLVLNLTHAHATRFTKNNGASNNSGYLLRLSCWRKWHATSHKLPHLICLGNRNWCHATSYSRNTLHQRKKQGSTSLDKEMVQRCGQHATSTEAVVM